LSRIPKQFLITDMDYVTRGLSDLIHSRDKLRGKQGLGNAGVDYGDPEVNESIARVVPKRKAARRLRRNYRPKGAVGNTRILSLHTDKDGLVLVENQSEYAAMVPPENLTVAIAVERKPSHCGFTAPEILAAWEALRDWADTGQQPSAFDLQATCEEFAEVLPGRCRIDPDFEIPDMDERIRPR
jgi:hypothetical protein